MQECQQCVGKDFFSQIFRPISTTGLQVEVEKKWHVQPGQSSTSSDWTSRQHTGRHNPEGDAFTDLIHGVAAPFTAYDIMVSITIRAQQLGAHICMTIITNLLEYRKHTKLLPISWKSLEHG